MEENNNSLQTLSSGNYRIKVKPAQIEFDGKEELERFVDNLTENYKSLVVTSQNYKESWAWRTQLNAAIKAVNRYRIDKSKEARKPIEDYFGDMESKLQSASNELSKQIKVFQDRAKADRHKLHYKDYLAILNELKLTVDDVPYNNDYDKTSYNYQRFLRDVRKRANDVIMRKKHEHEMRDAVISQAKSLALDPSIFLDQLKTKSLADVLSVMNKYKKSLIQIEKEKQERKREFENANRKVIGNKVTDKKTGEIIDEIHTFDLRLKLTKFQYDNLLRYLRDNGVKGKIKKVDID